MSKKYRNRTWKITFEGLYFAQVGGEVVQKPYKETATFNEDHVDAGVIGIWKKIVGPEILARKYPEFTNIYTHHLVDAKPSEGEIDDPRLMNRNQCIAFIDEKEYPVDALLYDDIDQLRQAILDYEEDPEAFAKNQQRRSERYRRKAEIKQSVLALNAPEALPKSALKAEEKKTSKKSEELGV